MEGEKPAPNDWTGEGHIVGRDDASGKGRLRISVPRLVCLRTVMVEVLSGSNRGVRKCANQSPGDAA